MLKISYEVISIDGWQRERTEGYAVQAIPFQAGHTESRLRCFRETNNSIVERLETYFIGGRREFDLDAFHGISNKSEMVSLLFVKRSSIMSQIAITSQVYRRLFATHISEIIT